MNRVIAQIVILVVMLLLVACDWDIMDLFESKYQRLTDYHYIINPSGKRMIHELTFSIPQYHGDSTLRYFSDGSNAQEELEWVVSYNVGPINAQPQSEVAYVSPFCLYSISDTTSLLWYKHGSQYDDSLKFCPFYWKYDGNLMCDDNECERIANYYVVVSDSLLSLMQKDYAMLDKFKEYYAQK